MTEHFPTFEEFDPHAMYVFGRTGLRASLRRNLAGQNVVEASSRGVTLFEKRIGTGKNQYDAAVGALMYFLDGDKFGAAPVKQEGARIVNGWIEQPDGTWLPFV